MGQEEKRSSPVDASSFQAQYHVSCYKAQSEC